ncbi:MAG: cyclic-phosphate processing receiver domain-containing protein [Flavobacteriales bacterium]
MKALKKYSLFLDDIRTVDMVFKEDPGFIIVRSYDAFVNYIKENGCPEFISFDNDLGEDENGNLLPDGYACVKWLVYENNFDLKDFRFIVHSANPVASVQIKSLLNNYIKHLNNDNRRA